MGHVFAILLLSVFGFMPTLNTLASSRVPASSPTVKEEVGSIPTYMYQCRRPPQNPEPVPEVKVDPNAPVSYVNQSDSFGSAAEQSTFLAIYQMHMGPYGLQNGPEARQKLLQETAEAIDDCVKNSSSCNEEKQKKVLKALVQLNQGLEIRCMMLANSNNRERMKSITQDKELGQLPDPVPANYLGTEFEYQKQAKSWKYEKVKSTKEMGRSAGIPDGEYFQLNENMARRTILSTEQEIMGANFIREYGIFMDNYTNTQREDGARYYKFVPVGEAAYAYQTDENGNRVIDQERFEQAIAEQSAPQVQGIVKDFRERVAKARPEITPPKKPGAEGADGRVKINPGVDFSEVGIGFDPASIPPPPENISYDDLKKNGELDDEGKARAVVRFLNDRFRKAAEEKRARVLASAPDPAAAAQAPRAYTHVTLDPAQFDQFLDNIWPSAATRERIRVGDVPPTPER